MAISVVSIVNRALDYLGQEPITSLDQGTVGARVMKRAYDASRDATLRAYPWNCAMGRASLAAETTAPAWGFAKQYVLPVDCLRVIEIQDDVTIDIPWRVEGRRILTDQSGPLNIRYVRQIVDPSEFDALTADALAVRLAMDTCRAVTGSTSDLQTLGQLFQLRITEARRIDAKEQSQDEEVIADLYLNARLGGYVV